MKPLPEALEEALREEQDLRNGSFAGDVAPELSPGSMDIMDCTFTGCHLTDCRFDHTGFRNVVFENCDLSGSRFFEGGLKDVVFRDCRMLGTVFTGCVLNSVTFTGCAARYLSLSECTLKELRLERCVFRNGAWISLKPRKITLTDCDFTGCDFRSTELKDWDMSGCVIEGCTWSADMLRGLTVNYQQAVELSRLLGLNVVP